MHDRPGPLGAVGDLQRDARGRRAARRRRRSRRRPWRRRPGSPRIRDGHVAAGAAEPLRDGRVMAVATRASSVPARGGGEPAERPGQTGQRDRHDRGAAAVDPGGGDRLAGQLGQRLAPSAAAAGGPGRGTSRGPSRSTTQVASIAACLPEQFWASDAGRPALGDPRDRRSSSSYGRSGVFCRSASVSPAPARIAAHAVEVERLAGVAGAGQGQQLAVEVEAGAQHRERLQRLVGATAGTSAR